MNSSTTGFALLLRSSYKAQSRESFLGTNSPHWDEITEACDHGPFSDKLDEHLDAAHGSCALHDPRLDQIATD